MKNNPGKLHQGVRNPLALFRESPSQFTMLNPVYSSGANTI